jgi:hypothetical protein
LTPKKETRAASEHIPAVALLTDGQLQRFGPVLAKTWPVDDATDFAELLTAIDEADTQLQGRLSSGESNRV